MTVKNAYTIHIDEKDTVYTTEELIKMPGLDVIAIGIGWEACHGLRFIGTTPKGDLRFIRINGGHPGEKVVLFKEKQEHTMWQVYSEAIRNNEASQPGRWKGKMAFLKDDGIYGEHIEGEIIFANELHVGLWFYNETATNQHNWARDKNGKPRYLRILDVQGTDQYLWDLVPETKAESATV